MSRTPRDAPRIRRPAPARSAPSAFSLLAALLLGGCASTGVSTGSAPAIGAMTRVEAPAVVPHAAWEAGPPLGHAADAGRRNLAVGDSLVFGELVVTVLAAVADSAATDSVLLALRTGEDRTEGWVAEGAAFNRGGFHVAVLAVRGAGELGGGLTTVEVATVVSLPPAVAASERAGGAELRLRIPHRITHITLHHTGSPEPLRPEDDAAAKLRGLQSWGAADRNWWDVPYHFLIGLDGTIYEGRDYRYAGETNTRYDPTGHLLISVIGNYAVQEAAPAQVEAIADLMAWGVSEFDVALDRIGGHYDYAETTCPGPHLARYLEDGTLRRMVEARLGRPTTSSLPPPAVGREFRALWVATVANIDWPSEPGLPAAAQREELTRLLDRAAEANFNAIILQVRTAGDALYDSPLEPWSEYLTGRQGLAPEPAYDPLAFAVEEAHRRGLELHAWFNPYRARHPSAGGPLAPDHLAGARPELVHAYGGHLWMDPGEPAVQDHTMAVILDVVRRYDIDGVHLDDYFYPYRELDAAGREIAFPDDTAWRRYVDGGGTLTRGDWRRDNVHRLIERLYREVKAQKSWVKVGISPFGLWRPGHPEPICCFDPYEQIYADSRTWLTNGWLDYFTPQLYWPIGQTPQSHALLLGWWAEQNIHQRHLWPGSFAGRVRRDSLSAGWPARELLAQIYLQRGHPGASGTVHFSARYVLRNPDGVVDSLRATAFAKPALVPASPWLGDRAPAPPRVEWAAPTATGPGVVRLEPGDGAGVWVWTVRVLRAGAWTVAVVPGGERAFPVEPGPPVERVAVSAVDRLGNESTVVEVVPAGIAPGR